jgi:hypothetical protein
MMNNRFDATPAQLKGYQSLKKTLSILQNSLRETLFSHIQDMESEPPVQIRPPPWNAKADVYWLALYLKAGVDTDTGVYAPLEASSPLITDPDLAGKHRGGLSLIMIVRYFEAPCGQFFFESS